MSGTSRLEQAGVALLATRLSVLGHDPCGGSEVLLWEDREIIQKAGIPVRVYGRAAENRAPAARISLHTNLPLVTSLEYCGQFLLREPKAVLMAYNEPTVAGLAPRRSIVRFDWSNPLPRYWKVPALRSKFQQALYLFPSESERQSFLLLHSRIPRDSTAVLPNAVDPNLFKPTGGGDSRLRVGFAGQWAPRKGVDVLLDAWSLVRSRLPAAALWLAGSARLWKRVWETPGAREIASRVEEQARQGLVRIAGEQKRSEMPAFWNSVCVAVVPSLYEPFGLVALEAMACGVPAVASAVDGLAEIIVDGESGLQVPPNDPKRLADALLTLLTNEPLRNHLAEGARRRAEAFSLERRAKDLLVLLARRAEDTKCAAA